MNLRMALVLTLITPLASALAASPNLLENSGFEFFSQRGGNADGWTTQVPIGGTCDTDSATLHSGRAALRLRVPAAAPLEWYQANRRAEPIRRGATYTLSAWVKTEDVRDGAGAYISINYFDGNGKRLGCFDSPGKQTGSAAWKCLASTGPVPDGTSELRVILCLHGRGTAWFDDVQVEEGSAPTPYQPSQADADREAGRQEEARTAGEWMKDLPPRAAGQSRIAVLDLFGASLPPPNPAGTSCPSDPAVLVDAFRAGGYAAFRLDPERAANPAFLDPANIDVLVVPSGDLFPAAAHRALVEYLRRGGAFLSMGGYAFDRPAIRHEGVWHDPAALPIPEAPLTPAFAAGTAGWNPSSNRKQLPDIQPITGPNGEAGVELSTPSLEGWDTVVSPAVDGKLPAGWSIIRFWARGDAKTPKAWVEWSETDGARWHKAIDLTPEWRAYALTPADFSYWHDNPSVGRGGPTDHFRPAQASRFQFGVALDIADRGQPHRVGIVGVSVQADPLAHLRLPAPRINTRWARIRDAMWPEPEQLGVFDPGFPLRDVAQTRPAPDQAVVADFALAAPLSGFSATAMLGLNGHGFGPNRARWVPLLECSDRFGRPRGHAGAIVHHFSGTFAGSSWAVFGAGNQDIFGAGSPALKQVLLPVTETLLRRLYLHETDTGYACYRRGESIVLRTRVSNFGAATQAAEVRFIVSADGAGSVPAGPLTRPVNLKPGETVDIEATWAPPTPAADLYRVTAELWAGDRRLDLEQTAVVVWSLELIAKGPVLQKDGTRFLLDGTPQFLMGCQTYWGQNGSVTARSPLAFDRDFRQMRDVGLRWTRGFIPFKDETDKRISDAIVQLAQKHGIVLYHTPNLPNTADPAELARQQATAREIAERYRGVPGLAVDICNEPAFSADDAGLLKLFGRPGKTAGEWQDPDATAFWWCMTNAQGAWAKANAAAIHAGDAARLASVGWSQGWAGGESMKDPILASVNLDFTDRHYYGRAPGFAAEFKDVDLRLLGKPLVLGECGAKDHPTFRAADPWGMGDDDASFDQRFLYLGHHALGLGAAVMSSWHWRDPKEGIFPCGLVHQTNVPRPTALLCRAMALAFGRFRPASATPAVCLLLPDAGRQSGQRDTAIRAFHRASDLLVAARVDFGLLPDSALDRLPGQVKAILYPLPLDPSDHVVERLIAFANAGGTAYLSGDLSYDGKRQPTQRERLISLCGVEAEGEALAAPLALPAVAGTLAPAAASGLLAGEARPFLKLRLAGAEAIASCNGAPVVTRFRLGKGQVWFSADPVELAGEMTASHLALYRTVLGAAGVPRFEATPDTPDLHVFRLAGEQQSQAWVFHNTGAALEVQAGDWTLGLASGGSGFLLLGGDGSLRAAECQGTLRRGATEVLRVSGHAFVVAEDDKNLVQSAQLLVLPLSPGQIQISTSRTATPKSEIGEMRDGQWHALAPAAATLAEGRLVITVEPQSAREMARVRW
jgi:hypothetical protein